MKRSLFCCRSSVSKYFPFSLLLVQRIFISEMDLGSEITSRLKGAIKAKLQELGSYIDDELPEYILVMISNKRSSKQMKEDLSLFLGDDTEKFVSWVFSVLSRLQDATNPSDVVATSEESTSKNTSEVREPKKLSQVKSSGEDAECAKALDKPKRSRSSSTTEKSSAERDLAPSIDGSKSGSRSDKNDEVKKSGKKESKKKEKKDKEDKDKAQKQLKAKPSLSSGSEEDVPQSKSMVASKVEVQRKQPRPSLPVSRQASGNLIKRAMEDARKSVKKPGVMASHEYSHDNSAAVVWIQDPELREQQKQVLLRQHRELEELRNIKDQLKKQKAMMDKTLPSQGGDEEAVEEEREVIREPDAEDKDDIELEVNDNEFVEDWIEVTANPKDRRVVDVSESHCTREERKNRTNSLEKTNSPVGSTQDKESLEPKEPVVNKSEHKERDSRREVRSLLSRSGRDRHSRRRHGRGHRDHGRHHDRKQDGDLDSENTTEREELFSPKFVVTLNGIDSDYEKKFDDENRRERRKRKFYDKHSPTGPDTLFINLDKRTNNLKPLEIMQQALLTIQQPLLQVQPGYLPSTLDVQPQTMSLQSQPGDPFRPFDLRNHLGLTQNALPPMLPNPAAMSMSQAPVVSLPTNPTSQITSRNLTNLVPLSVASTKGDSMDFSFEQIRTEGTNRSPSTVAQRDKDDLRKVPSVEKVRIRLNSESAEEEENDMETDAILERCKFWPECKNGVSCAYVHPTVPCKLFPSCSYSDNCIFLHPVCKFDGRCTNVSCQYTHTSKQRVFAGSGSQTNSTGSDASTPLCRFYPNCSKKFCTFRHPSAKPCRYGSGCTRSDCLFVHETKPADRSALTWTAVAKEPKSNPSNRKFACPDSAVTAVPVSVST